MPLLAALVAAFIAAFIAIGELEIGSGVSVRRPIRKAFRATLSPSAMSRLLLAPELRCAPEPVTEPRLEPKLDSDASDGGTGNVPRW
jgi:hypothetical protein